METKSGLIQIKKTLHLLRNVENEKLYQLVNNTFQELSNLTSEHTVVVPTITLLKEKFNPIYDRILSLLKKETNFILPYIDKVLDKVNQNASDTFIVYSNLTIPLKRLIIEQSKIMDLLEELKGISFSTIADTFVGKIILSLIEICQLFERHIFIEQRILIPSIIQLIEIVPSVKINKDLETYVGV